MQPRTTACCIHSFCTDFSESCCSPQTHQQIQTPPLHIFACREEKRQRIFPPYCPGSGSPREQQAGPDQTGRCGGGGRLARRAHSRYDIMRISRVSSDRCCRLYRSGGSPDCARTRSLSVSRPSVSCFNHTLYIESWEEQRRTTQPKRHAG